MDTSLATPRRSSCNPFDSHEYEVGGFAGTIGYKLYLASLKGEDTDVVLQCGSDPTHIVEAHSPILKSESSVFKVMLCERWKLKSDEELKSGKVNETLPDDDVEDFKSFLKLVYGFQHLQKRDFSWVVPGWKLADKYVAERVLDVCKSYFETLARHIGKTDVTKVLAVARAYECTILEEAALNHIKKNLHLYWQSEKRDWVQWDEKTIIAILATDFQKILLEERKYLFNWSENECSLLSFAAEWVEHQSKTKAIEEDNEGPSEAKAARVIDSALALRVLKNIRFCQIVKDKLGQCMMQLMGLLSAEQIGQIYLIHSGSTHASFVAAYGNNNEFVVDTRLRPEHHVEPEIEVVPVQNQNEEPKKLDLEIVVNDCENTD